MRFIYKKRDNTVVFADCIFDDLYNFTECFSCENSKNLIVFQKIITEIANCQIKQLSAIYLAHIQLDFCRIQSEYVTVNSRKAAHNYDKNNII